MNGYTVSETGNLHGKEWIVQKFGGTSVGKFPDKVCPSNPC